MPLRIDRVRGWITSDWLRILPRLWLDVSRSTSQEFVYSWKDRLRYDISCRLERQTSTQSINLVNVSRHRLSVTCAGRLLAVELAGCDGGQTEKGPGPGECSSLQLDLNPDS